MSKKSEAIQTASAPAAIGPYSQAIRSGELLFCSGQIGLDPVDGTLVGGGLEQQASRVLDNLQAVLEAAGGGLADCLKLTVYLTDLSGFPTLNAIMERRLTAPYPARATVEVSALPLGALVEIDMIARIAGRGDAEGAVHGVETTGGEADA